MESKANYALVGVVVIVLTVALVSGVLWVSSRGAGSEQNNYTIYFKDQTLDGLQVDSNVTMKGIKVGNVNNFQISKRNIEVVRVDIRLNADTPVKRDTRAVIRRNLLTGLAYIDLIGSSQPSPLLTATGDGEDYPVIPEGVSELSAITDSVPNLLEKGSVLIDNVLVFFSKENQKSIEDTLAGAARFTQTLAKNDKEIDALISNFSKLATDHRTASASITKATEGNKLPELADEFRTTLAAIRDAAEKFDKNFGQVANSLRDTASALAKEIGKLSLELTRAAENFSASLERLDEPRSILLGPPQSELGPGEQTRKTEVR